MLMSVRSEMWMQKAIMALIQNLSEVTSILTWSIYERKKMYSLLVPIFHLFSQYAVTP